MAIITTDSIRIVGEWVDKITGPMKRSLSSYTTFSKKQGAITKSLGSMNQNIEKNRAKFHKHGLTVRQAQKGMANLGMVVNSSGEIFEETTGRQIKSNRAYRQLGASVQRFRMYLLSVMFAGMMITRVFGGMIKPVLELTGLTDVWKAALIDLLLPVLLPITDALMNFLFYLMDLPDAAKKTIGILILAGFAFGLILMVVGQVGLAIAGLTMLLGSLGIPLAILLIPLILAFGAGLFSLASGFFKTSKKGKEFNKQMLAMGIPLDSLVEKFTKWGKIIVSKIKEKLPEIIDKVGEWMVWIRNTIVENLPIVIKGLSKMLKEVIKFLANNLPKFISAGLDILLAIVEGLEENIDEIINAIEEIVDSILNWVNTHGARLAKVGLRIGWAIIKGIAKAFWGISVSIGGWLDEWSRRGGFWGEKMAVMQQGGIIPETGPYILHKGETVIPSGMGGGGIALSPTININASISSDYDVRKLATELSRYWVQDLNRYSKTRGI